MLRGPGGLEPLIFGSGVHGSVLLNVDNTTLTSEIYAEDVTVTAIINTGGCRIFARDFIKVTSTGKLLAKGSNASGVTGGVASPSLILDSGLNGPNGGNNAAGVAGTDVNISLGGNGGQGGNSSSNSGGVGGGFIFSGLAESQYNLLTPILGGLAWDGSTSLARLTSGTSGGSGGGHGLTGNGGGAGAPGGGMVLAAPEITVDGGVIDVSGGNGANGTGIAATNGGGGGGGGGGTLWMIYGALNVISGGVIRSNGGNAGNGSTGAFGGFGGSAGSVFHFTNGYLATRVVVGTNGTNGTP